MEFNAVYTRKRINVTNLEKNQFSGGSQFFPKKLTLIGYSLVGKELTFQKKLYKEKVSILNYIDPEFEILTKPI